MQQQGSPHQTCKIHAKLIIQLQVDTKSCSSFCHCLPIDFEVQNSNEGSSQGKYQIIKKYLSQHDFDHLFLGAGPPRKRTNSQKSKVSIKGGLNIPNMDPFTLYSIQDSESCCVSPFPYFSLFLDFFNFVLADFSDMLDFRIFFVYVCSFFQDLFPNVILKHFIQKMLHC